MTCLRRGVPFAVLLLAACQPGVQVTREEYGPAWPFTVERGYVDCHDGAATFRSNGIEYQLNGTAMTRGYRPLESIWRENPDIPGTRIGLGDILERALKECG